MYRVVRSFDGKEATIEFEVTAEVERMRANAAAAAFRLGMAEGTA